MSPAAAAAALIGIVVMAAVAVAYELSTRTPPEEHRQPRRAVPAHHAIRGDHGPRHARTAFPDPRDVSDPDGSVWLRALRHEVPQSSLAEMVRACELPAPGALSMLPPDPPSAETGPLPVAVCELGMTADEYVDALFARAEAALAERTADLLSDMTGRAA